MINKINIYIYKKFVKFIIYFTKNSKMEFDPKDLNFGLIDFDDQIKIKSVYISFSEITPSFFLF